LTGVREPAFAEAGDHLLARAEASRGDVDAACYTPRMSQPVRLLPLRKAKQAFSRVVSGAAAGAAYPITRVAKPVARVGNPVADAGLSPRAPALLGIA